MAIDSSVYILFPDGSIRKYTRAQPDSFSLTGLDTPFSNPTKIFTDKETESVYVLDSGNSRIVKLSKDGAFQKSYPVDRAGQAKDFEVMEQDNKILLLSNDKIWEISL